MPCDCPTCQERLANPEPCSVCGQSFIPGITDRNLDYYRRCDACSIRCIDCNSVHRTSDELDNAGRCSDCTHYCSECGEEYENRDEFHDGRCPDCSYTCDNCGRDCTSIDSVGYCENCHHSCDSCGEDVTSVDDYGRCDSCSRVCENCGETCRYLNDSGYCDYCESENQDEDGSVIHEYDYKPDFWNKHTTGTETNKFLFGHEIEAEIPTSKDVESEVERVSLDVEKWFWKKDGSIRHGAEAVSHPASFEYITANGHFDWTEEVSKRDWKAWDTITCGGHIHVSRNALSKLDIFKLVYFFSLYPDWVYKISRRNSRDKFNEYAEVDTDSRAKIAHKVNYQNDGNRYRSINITNRKTVEFRLFRGTLSKHGIIVNTALVYMLCLYVKYTSIQNLTPASFRVWVSDNANKWLSPGCKESVLKLARGTSNYKEAE